MSDEPTTLDDVFAQARRLSRTEQWQLMAILSLELAAEEAPGWHDMAPAEIDAARAAIKLAVVEQAIPYPHKRTPGI
jgi:hypothetical protein